MLLIKENKMKIVNLEFPLSRMGEALTVLANIIEPAGLHLHGVSEPSGDSDSGIQVKAIAYTNASAYQWFTFCMLFNQDCVALSYDGVTGLCVGPNADQWPFNPEYFIMP